MAAKIKLNATSGGGSISINAPTSAGSDTDFLDTSGNLAVSGTTTCTGNLKVGTITDTSGNNSSTTAQIAQGRCKAWVNYNGGSVSSPRDSFNVDSITSIASGKHQINFTTQMPNLNYAFFGSSAQADEDNLNPCFCFPYQYDSNYNRGSVRIKTGYHTNNSNAINVANRSFTSIGIFGD